MFTTSGILYGICTWIYRFLLMSLLGLLFCLPIVTVPAAMAAMVGLARRMHRGDESPILKQFRSLFVENFAQSMVCGWIVIVIGVFLVIDFRIIANLHTAEHVVMSVVLTVALLFYIYFILNLFPLMVHAHMTNRQLMAATIKLSFYKPYLTLLNLLALLAMLVVASHMLLLLLLLYPGAAAYITYAFASRKFRALHQA